MNKMVLLKELEEDFKNLEKLLSDMERIVSEMKANNIYMPGIEVQYELAKVLYNDRKEKFERYKKFVGA